MATSGEQAKEHRKDLVGAKTPPVVSAQEWEAARQRMLEKEKAFTHSRDALAAERRRMPWLAIEKNSFLCCSTALRSVISWKTAIAPVISPLSVRIGAAEAIIATCLPSGLSISSSRALTISPRRAEIVG